MEQHFPINFFYSFSEFPNKGKEPFVKNGTANFGRNVPREINVNKWSTSRGDPEYNLIPYNLLANFTRASFGPINIPDVVV